MAKLSELLTGDPKTWKKVVRSGFPEHWIQFLARIPHGQYVGYDHSNDPRCSLSEDDWEYYEEPKPSYEKERAHSAVCYRREDNSIAHVFVNDDIACNCGRQKRLIPNIVLMDHTESKPKVTRWLWSYKGKNGGYFNSAQFLTEEETKGYQWMGCTHVTKLPWTATEFEE